MKKLLVLLSVSLFPTSSLATDIPRDGDIRVPSKQEAISICKKNTYIDSNFLLAACVQQEQESASGVLRLIRDNREAASKAYWACVKNEFIDNHMLLFACMQQELEALDYLQN